MLPAIFALIIDAMGFGLVYPVMTALFTSTDSQILPAGASISAHHFYLGIAFLLYPACMFFGCSIMADLSDHFGRQRILALCMAGITISFLLMGLGAAFDSLTLLFIGRAASGLMAGSQPIAQAMIGDISTEQNKTRNMGIVTFAYCAGVVLGPLLGGVLSDQALFHGFSISLPFYVAAALSFLATLTVMVFLKDQFKPDSSHRISLLRPITLFIDAMSHSKIRALSLIFLLNQIGFSIYFQFIVVHMRLTYHYSNWQLGALNSMLGLGFGIGLLLLLPRLTKNMKTTKMAKITYGITALLIIIAPLSHYADPQWVFAILIAAIHIVAFTATLTLFSDSVESSRQGWAMGIANAMIALAWTITGLGSNLISLIGSDHLILIGGISYFISFIIFIYMSKIKHI